MHSCGNDDDDVESVRLIGYARVSTEDQDLTMQTEALLRAGVSPDNLYTDKKSGKNMKRRGLQAALLDARPGDTLVVWRFDRLSRSLRDLILLLDQLNAEGIELRSLHEQVDTNTPMGKLMFQLAGILAEFERSLTSYRTKHGMQEAKRFGAKFGPDPALSPRQVQQAINMLKAARKKKLKPGEKRVGPVQIAAKFGVSRVTLYQAVLRVTKGKKLWRDGPLARKK